MKKLKKNTGGNIDLASSLINYFIENKVDKLTVGSLNAELDEANEELDIVCKENDELKNLINTESENYKLWVELDKRNKIIEKEINPELFVRKYKKKK